MKHATPDTLRTLEPLLVELRALDGLVEKRPGAFSHRSRAVLHFHDDPSGIYADVRLPGADDFTRRRVTTRAEQRALLKELRVLKPA